MIGWPMSGFQTWDTSALGLRFPVRPRPSSIGKAHAAPHRWVAHPSLFCSEGWVPQHPSSRPFPVHHRKARPWLRMGIRGGTSPPTASTCSARRCTRYCPTAHSPSRATTTRPAISPRSPTSTASPPPTPTTRSTGCSPRHAARRRSALPTRPPASTSPPPPRRHGQLHVRFAGSAHHQGHARGNVELHL